MRAMQVVVTRGQPVQGPPGPIIVATRNDALQGVLDATPADRREGPLHPVPVSCPRVQGASTGCTCHLPIQACPTCEGLPGSHQSLGSGQLSIRC